MPPEASSNLPARDFAGVGERALLVAEQFAFQQRFGERRAVDGDERLIAAAAEVVDRAGDDLLAGAVFAEDQNRQVGVGDAADRRSHGLDRRALADELQPLGRLLDELLMLREQLFELLRVFQRDRGVCRQLDECVFVLVGEVPLALVEHLEGAQRTAAGGHQRHAQDGARLVAGDRSTWRSISSSPSPPPTRRGSPV